MAVNSDTKESKALNKDAGELPAHQENVLWVLVITEFGDSGRLGVAKPISLTPPPPP